MTTTKKQPTNPFVYVIAAAVIAILALGIRFIIDALDNHNAAIEKVTEVKDYLNRDKGQKNETPAPTQPANTGTTPSGTVTQ